MSNFETIDSALLVTATGGQQAGGAGPEQYSDEAPPSRTWGQMARQYAGACVQGAGQSLMYGGRPRSVREGLTTAAMGCAIGMGQKAVDDISGAIGGDQR